MAVWSKEILKNYINLYIRNNGNKTITGTQVNTALINIVDSMYTGSESGLTIDAGTNIEVTGTTVSVVQNPIFRGLVTYQEDLSHSYTDRSLIDKGYLTTTLSGLTGQTSITSSLETALSVETVQRTSTDNNIITSLSGETSQRISADSSLSSSVSSKENILTFESGLRRNVNTVTNTLVTGLDSNQSIIGGTENGLNLKIYSNNASTKGKIYLGDNNVIDEQNNYLGVGTNSPTANLTFGTGSTTINMIRSNSATTSQLTIESQAAKSGETDKAGGNLYLKSGISTGKGYSKVYISTPYTADGYPSGTSDNPHQICASFGFEDLSTVASPYFRLYSKDGGEVFKIWGRNGSAMNIKPLNGTSFIIGGDDFYSDGANTRFFQINAQNAINSGSNVKGGELRLYAGKTRGSYESSVMIGACPAGGSGVANSLITHLKIYGTTGLVWNDDGYNVDCRFEGDNDPNMVVFDASADAVGFGTLTPTSKNHLSAAGVVNTQWTNTATGNLVSNGTHIGIDIYGNTFIEQKENLDINIIVNNNLSSKINNSAISFYKNVEFYQQGIDEPLTLTYDILGGDIGLSYDNNVLASIDNLGNSYYSNGLLTINNSSINLYRDTLIDDNYKLYFNDSISIDTVNDIRFYSSGETFYIDNCTISGSTKGNGTWNNGFMYSPNNDDIGLKLERTIDDGTGFALQTWKFLDTANSVESTLWLSYNKYGNNEVGLFSAENDAIIACMETLTSRFVYGGGQLSVLNNNIYTNGNHYGGLSKTYYSYSNDLDTVNDIRIYNSGGTFIIERCLISGSTKGSGTWKNINEPQILTDGSTITYDVKKGLNASVTLGGNRTLTITNAVTGDTGILKIIQDGTGSRDISTWPSGSLFAGADSELSTTGNSIDIFGWYYDGTNYFWSKNLAFS